MTTAKSIINLGLGKIAANKIVSIDPPKSPVEKHCAEGYPTWRDDEISKREWHFARVYAALVLSPNPSDPVVGDGKVYRYATPNDMIRAIRDKRSEWEQRGLFIYSSQATLTIPYMARVSENSFPPSFVNVLASRVACECVEFTTQSNTKDDTATTKYVRAVGDASRLNMFVLGPSDIRTDDSNDEWLLGRLGTGITE